MIFLNLEDLFLSPLISTEACVITCDVCLYVASNWNIVYKVDS